MLHSDILISNHCFIAVKDVDGSCNWMLFRRWNIHMHIHIYIYIWCFYPYTNICIYTLLLKYTCIHMHKQIYATIYIDYYLWYTYIHIHIYIYICIYQYNVLWNCIFIHHLPVHGSHPFVWDTFQWFSGAIFWGYTPSHLGAFILILHQLSHTPHWQDLPEAKGRMRRTATRICIGIGARGLVSVVILNDYVQTKELSMGIILYIMGWILFLTRRSSMGIIVYIMG